jgi:hypothetical protein
VRAYGLTTRDTLDCLCMIDLLARRSGSLQFRRIPWYGWCGVRGLRTVVHTVKLNRRLIGMILVFKS